MKIPSLPAQQLLKSFMPTQVYKTRTHGLRTTYKWTAIRQTRSAHYKSHHIAKAAAPTTTPPDPSSPIRLYAIFAIAGLFVVIGVSKQLENSSQKKIFDPPRFTPFEIIKREEASPTSIILTLRPRNYDRTQELDKYDPYKEEWEKGTWSVEFKQPELQIARRYTPLPPAAGAPKTELRFLIRKEHKGEMSGYLQTLNVGAEIGLRGPHLEYELPKEVLGVNRVVFLAAGTGIAPAIQLIHTLLERRDQGTEMRIIWANRRREDCVGGLPAAPLDLKTRWSKPSLGKTHKADSKIVQELEDLKEKYPGRLSIDYLVDEEGHFLDQKRIVTTVDSEDSKSTQLLFISGPDGFVNYVAGPKRWENGKEEQGSLGGILGKINLKNWIVWKL